MSVGLSPRRVKLVTIAILAIGLGTAVVVYFVAAQRPENPLGYDPLETKKYLHDLEVYGGKMNVLATEFQDWFAGLWYGRNLAYTIAVITLLTVAAFRGIVALRARARMAEMEETFEDPDTRWGPHRL